MEPKDRARPRRRLALLSAAPAFVAIAIFAVQAKAQTIGEGLPNLEARVEPLRPGATEGQVFAELATHNEERKAGLHHYTV